MGHVDPRGYAGNRDQQENGVGAARGHWADVWSASMLTSALVNRITETGSAPAAPSDHSRAGGPIPCAEPTLPSSLPVAGSPARPCSGSSVECRRSSPERPSRHTIRLKRDSRAHLGSRNRSTPRPGRARSREAGSGRGRRGANRAWPEPTAFPVSPAGSR